MYEPLALRVSQEEARLRLAERMRLGRLILDRPVATVDGYQAAVKEYRKWDDFNVALLEQIFTNSEIAKKYDEHDGPLVISVWEQETFAQKVNKHLNRVDQRVHTLDSIIERIELFPVAPLSQPQSSIPSTPDEESTVSNKVFVVHGRDDAAKANLEAFLREIGLQPVVLHRQADEGLTVIEKFEKHSDVRYAFILLTPDEIAYLVSDSSKSESDRQCEKRARPNVIFEWGYFVGKLGRSRVCCISTGSVVLPSDMSGLVTKRYLHSIEEVGYSIIKDLRAAGIDARMQQ